ncbi:hypothetical protein JOC86_001024 [Bacillus pakistanensis]|uniref:Lipoprotein n=1 Tax=Rossellomorea pakistanensis TaxID=992288 RepID=A0ABS2N9G5_9BACI|nr:DUF6241 domain-containing protein [Bacillus pakistanensis]MBM7584487.1 hypothetical protein [Bacillus pakistanensis]
MKKSLTVAGLGLALAIGGSYAIFSYKGEKTEAATTTKHEATQQVPKVSQAELTKASKDIGEIKNDDDVYYTMITIALQKLKFQGEKNYHIPGTPDVKRLQLDLANLQYLKNKAVAIKASELYQKTLDKWLKGDFSNIENDYLTIRSIKTGTTQPSESPVLKVRTAEEEQKYIEHFFGEEGLQINKRDWQ